MIESIVLNLPIGSFPVKGYSEYSDWYSSGEIATKHWFTQHIQPHWHILDAGANIGMYSILFSKLAFNGMVYCFEPTDTMDLLSENLQMNGIQNSRLYNMPLGKEKTQKIDKIYKIWPNVIDNKLFDFTTIDEFVKESGVKLDAIKIDVDSYDYEVLQGAEQTLLTQSPYVMVELNHALHLRGFQPDDAIQYMNRINYKVVLNLDGDNYLFTKNLFR